VYEKVCLDELGYTTHPTIKNGSEKHIEFKNWYENKYIKSGLLDKIINHFNT
jgi:hypothetical protein